MMSKLVRLALLALLLPVPAAALDPDPSKPPDYTANSLRLGRGITCPAGSACDGSPLRITPTRVPLPAAIAAGSLTAAGITTSMASAVVSTITTSGYGSPGDAGAGCVYVRGMAQVPGAQRDALGAWWRLKVGATVDAGCFGAAPDDSLDDIAAINAALSTGASVYLSRGVFAIGQNKIQFVREGQRLVGENYFDTILDIDYRRATTNMSLDAFVGVVHHASVEGVKFREYQDPQATRATLRPYPPIGKPTNAYRARFRDVFCERCWSFMDAPGNNTFIFENVHLGIFYRGLVMDGSYDFSRFDGVYFWPYGIANVPSLEAAYYDGTALALDIGRADGWNATNLNVFGVGVRFWGGAEANGTGAAGNIASLYLDHNAATLTVSGGTLNIGSLSSTKSTLGPRPGGSPWPSDQMRVIDQSGGALTIGAFQTNSYGGDAPIVVSGGMLSIGSGDLWQQSKDAEGITVTGGDVFIGGGFVMRGRPNELRSVPFGHQSGTGGLHYMGGIRRFSGDGGVGLRFDTDTLNNYCDQKAMSKWPCSIGSFTAPIKGSYQ